MTSPSVKDELDKLKAWEHSNGHNILPDDIIIASDFVTGSGLAQGRYLHLTMANEDLRTEVMALIF